MILRPWICITKHYTPHQRTVDHDPPVVPVAAGLAARRIAPYKLWYVNNALYAVGHDHRSNELRKFAVVRISAAEVSHQRFQIPPDFDLDFEKLSESAFKMFWGKPRHVRIRFRADQAP
jgi:predicted DNA-binding transcriptional regulator YafY